MAEIKLNSWDLHIAKTGDGDEVVQIKQGFNEDFIQAMREQGVKDKAIFEDGDDDNE